MYKALVDVDYLIEYMQYTLGRRFRYHKIQTARADNAAVDGHNIQSCNHGLVLNMRCVSCSLTAKLPVLQLWEAD